MSHLITDTYREQNALEHSINPKYGAFGSRWANEVSRLASESGSNSILDYGCGKGTLKASIGGFQGTIREYDPAIPGKDSEPEAADLVVCTDVLEHIEPALLDNVLRHLFSKVRKMAFIVIAQRKGSALPDGTIKHQIIRSSDWWISKLSKFGKVKRRTPTQSKELVVTVTFKRKRWEVIRLLAIKHRWKIGAELGVFKGECLEPLLEHGLYMIAVDLWGDLPVNDVPKDMNTGQTNYHKHPLSEYETLVRTIAARFEGRCRIIKDDTVNAAALVEDRSLDFVFVDACHETAAVEADIRAWHPKLKDNGMMMGHDRSWPSVRKAIDNLCPGWKGANDSVWYLPKKRVRI